MLCFNVEAVTRVTARSPSGRHRLGCPWRQPTSLEGRRDSTLHGSCSHFAFSFLGSLDATDVAGLSVLSMCHLSSCKPLYSHSGSSLDFGGSIQNVVWGAPNLWNFGGGIPTILSKVGMHFTFKGISQMHFTNNQDNCWQFLWPDWTFNASSSLMNVCSKIWQLASHWHPFF